MKNLYDTINESSYRCCVVLLGPRGRVIMRISDFFDNESQAKAWLHTHKKDYTKYEYAAPAIKNIKSSDEVYLEKDKWVRNF